MITNKNLLIACAMIFCSPAHARRAPLIPDNGELRICGKEVCNAFFETIKNGTLPEAAEEDVKYMAEAKNLTSLDLSWETLGTFPSEIGLLKNLKTLQIKLKRSVPLPSEVIALDSLEELEFQSDLAFRDTVPLGITQMTNLKKLKISHSQLNSLPPEMINLQELRELNLENNNFTEIPEVLFKLQKLESLRLKSNNLKSVPQEIKEIKNLKIMDMSSNQFDNFPDAICELFCLTNLDLSWNQVEEIPKEIGNLTSLEQLDLSRNKISTVPYSIAKLKNLALLDLCCNKITHIPKEISELGSLEFLGLYNNKLRVIPHDISKLTNLTTLNLRLNNIVSIPPEIFTSLKKLKKLWLDGNDLIFIPAEVITSNHLEELSLQTSKIETNKSQIESLHPLVTRWMEKRKSLLNKFEQEIVESQLRKENARNILEINMLMCGLPDESNFFGWKSCSPALCVPTPDRHKTLLLSHPIHSELFIKKLISDPVFREIMEGYQIKLKMSKSLSCKETIQITSEEKCVDEIKPQNKLDRTKKNKSCLVLESEGQAIVMQVMAELSEEYRKNIAGVQVLDMSNIGLTFLSPAIRHFKKLERLFLENNHLCELPDEIGELKNLTFLALGGNELFRLPASIRKISKLGGITLDGNSLDPNEKLPLFEAMRKLHVLSIDDPEIIMQLYNRCKRNHEKLARLTKMLAVSLNLPREEKPKTKEAPNRGLPLLTLLRGKEENEPKKKHRHKNHLLPPPMPDRVPNLKLPAIAGTTKAITSRT